MTMTKKQRIKAAVNLLETDRVPYAFWTHLPHADLDAEKLAEETYEFYKKYDLDFIKTMNNGMYPIEDFGCKVDYSQIEKGGVAKLTYSPIKSSEDWCNLQVCSFKEGSLARELKSLQLLLDKIKDEDVPVIFTVFSPITTADKLCGGNLGERIKNGEGENIKKALKVITETTAALSAEAIKMGADGVFLASQMSVFGAMSEEMYLEYGKPFDLEVLEAAKDGWLNAIHAHGEDIMMDVLADYPVNVFNWHAWETLPEMDEAKAITGKCLMGGLVRTDITECNKNNIRNQIFKAIKQTEGKGLILTPGCVVRYPLDHEMLCYVREIKESLEEKLKVSK